MPLILGTNSIKDTGYDVANSLRLDEPSNQGLTKTPSGAGNRKTFTLSICVKREKITNQTGDVQTMFESRASNNDNCALTFQTDDTLSIKLKVSGTNKSLITDRVFRDVSAWYHLVCAVDTTQSTASSRVKIYVNGEQENSFGTENYPSQDAQTSFNNSVGHGIGKRSDTTSQNFDGYFTEVVMIDGQALDPTSFGEFDSDSPNIWKPKDVSGLTFGTNGFHLDFEDSSALGNDVSGNNNDYSVTNLSAVNQSIDTCTNNFATFNSLITFPSNPPDFSEGNLKVETIDSDPGHFGGASTIGVSQGKWYFESTSLSSREIVTAGGGTISHAVGIHSDPSEAARQGTSFSPQFTGGFIYALNGKIYSTATGTSGSSYGSTYAHNDIIGVAIDLDNHKLYFSKNGTFQNSGDPTSGSTGTGALSITTGLTYFAFVTDVGGSAVTSSINFGSPINSISSGNSDSEGFGNFAHSVPSGYFSLCSSNLAEYG